MSAKSISNYHRGIIKNMQEPTPDNMEILKSMILESKVVLKQIWEALSDDLKNNEIVQKTFLNSMNQNNLNSVISILQGQGVSLDDIYSHMKSNNEELFKFCIRNNRVPFDNLIAILEQEPQWAENLTTRSPIKEMATVCPKIGAYLSNNVPKNKEKLSEKALGETKFWKEDGQVVQYYELSADIKFKDREDYKKLVDAYIKEDSSILQFCDKYRIENIKGFEKVISQFEREDYDIKKQVQEVKEHAQKRYLHYMKDKLIPDVLGGKTTYNEVIHTHSLINAWDFMNAKKYLDDNTYSSLMDKMLCETGIVNGMSETILTEKDENGIEYQLIGNMSIEHFIEWFSYSKTAQVSEVSKGIDKLLVQVKYSKLLNLNAKDISRVNNLCLAYLKPIQKENWVNNMIFLKDDKECRPTEENVEDAIEYLKATNRHLCNKNLKSPLKAIIFGTLTKEDIQKAKMKKEQQSKKIQHNPMKNIRSIDEYIEFCGTNKPNLIESYQNAGVKEEDLKNAIKMLETGRGKDEALTLEQIVK